MRPRSPTDRRFDFTSVWAVCKDAFRAGIANSDLFCRRGFHDRSPESPAVASVLWDANGVQLYPRFVPQA
eukprot:6019029-Pyramimonas_sp.AAC.1